MMEGSKIKKRRGRRRLWQFLAFVAVIAVVGYFFLEPSSEAGLAEYRMGAVQMGAVISTVAATGTVNAVGTVEVTSQVAGQIIEVLVDYNSQVTEGQVLARVNPETFEVKLIQAEADLAISNASLVSNRASVERARSDLRNAEASLQGMMAQVANAQISLESAQRDWQRQLELFERKVISNVALEQARAQFEQAQASLDQINSNLMAQTATLDGRRASLEIAQSGVVTATAQVQQREASLAAARIELANTAVRSPVDGVIIERAVEKGQTAASSTNSNATLFTIAENLRNMQVEVSVDEADIGIIREGMRTTFTVDSYPGREFTGIVAQVRFAPKTVQNVVTYIVVVSAPNPDLALLPGLTASVRMIVSERQDVLRIPNAALRFEPFGFEAPEQAGRGGGGGGAPAGGFGGGGDGGFGGGNAAAGDGDAPAGGGGAAAGGRGGGGDGGRGGGIANQLPPGLDLTEEQLAEVQAGLGDVRQEFGALRQQGVPAEEIQARFAARLEEALLPLLTDEQKAIYEAAQGQTVAAGAPAGGADGQRTRRGGGGGGGPDAAPAAPIVTRTARIFLLDDAGVPQPMTVTVGISDTGFTELVRGDLIEGQQVVIGASAATLAAQANAAAGGGGNRFRFGF